MIKITLQTMLCLIVLAFCMPLGARMTKHQVSSSGLESIIPPEIRDDAFYQAIYKLASEEEVHTILEIGSSSGEGSTQAFVTGIRLNPYQPTLYCMEISKPRFGLLQQHYADEPSVVCYNVSSVPIEAFPTEGELIAFYNKSNPKLRIYLHWLKQDLDYIRSSGVPQNGIEIIKTENGIQNFDVVLIDGSEFSGHAEFHLIYGARFILLDDIDVFKNHKNFHQLLQDPHYTLLEENHTLRNGYAIFKRNS